MDGIAVMGGFDHALCNICPVSPPDGIHKVEVVTVIFVLGRSFRPNWFLFGQSVIELCSHPVHKYC